MRAETRTGRVRGLLVAGVAALAAGTLFVVWRERRDGVRDVLPELADSTVAPTAAAPGSELPPGPRSARMCRGRLVFADGEPAASVGFVVESRPSDEAPYVVVGRGLSKSDGSFALELFETWQYGRPVRFAASPGERLNIDALERSLPSDAPLEIAVSGARVTLQVVDSRGAPVRDLKLCYRMLEARDASTETVLQFGTTDRGGRDYLDFVSPQTIVVWAVNVDDVDCTDRVEIAAQHGVRANRTTLTAPRLPLPGGLRVTVVDEFDSPLEQAFVSLTRGRHYLPCFNKSDETFVYEHLEPGEYTLQAQPTSTGAESNDPASPPYLAAEMRLNVSDRVEDVRVSLQRAALLVLDVVRTSESPEFGVFLRLPEELEAASRAVGAARFALRGLTCTRFVDAAGVVRWDSATRCSPFHVPGRYWLQAPPGTFEVVIVQVGEEPRYFPRGLVELKSGQETTRTVKF